MMALDMQVRRQHLLLGCTGSVATIKLPQLLTQLSKCNNLDIRVVVTEKAKHFYSSEDIPPDVAVYSDQDEWTSWSKRGDPVLHIDLGKWADVMLIAPLDANTLAKIAQGVCDNLLTCVARAWDLKKPLLFCPAMNTRMWEHPVTAQQVTTLNNWGFVQVPCIEKTLMCGDTGLGAMAELPTIVERVYATMNIK